MFEKVWSEVSERATAIGRRNLLILAGLVLVLGAAFAVTCGTVTFLILTGGRPVAAYSAPGEASDKSANAPKTKDRASNLPAEREEPSRLLDERGLNGEVANHPNAAGDTPHRIPDQSNFTPHPRLPSDTIADSQSKQQEKAENPANPPVPEPLQKLLVGPELDEPIPINYLRVTAEQLVMGWYMDRKATLKRYSRPIQIEGVVEEIGSDEDGKFIAFCTTLPLRFMLVGDDIKRQAEKFKPGDKTALRSKRGLIEIRSR
jgi:hypothetical protein